MIDWKAPFVDYFRGGIKETKSEKLGVEVEHFILDRGGAAVPYAGEGGVRQVLSRLMDFYPEAEILPDDDFFGFQVPDFTVTLEPAAQLEISIAPRECIRQIARIYRGFSRHLQAVLEEFGYTAASCGCQPVSRVADLDLIPKRRYHLMNDYFLSSGTGGMEMMRGTASLQVSIDYHSEEDFRRKIQAAYFYGPVLRLLGDNAGSFQGLPLTSHLKRTDIWRRVDPARCGVLPNVFSEMYGFGDYADFIGRMPPIFLKNGKCTEPTGSRTVSEILAGREPDEALTAHLLSMAFPDVRLKKVLEVRFCDSVPAPFKAAYCGLVKGLLYSEEGLDFAKRQIAGKGITESDIILAEDCLMERGWEASVFGSPVRELAEEYLELARRNIPDEERRFLGAFDAVAEFGGIRSLPAEKNQELWDIYQENISEEHCA